MRNIKNKEFILACVLLMLTIIVYTGEVVYHSVASGHPGGDEGGLPMFYALHWGMDNTPVLAIFAFTSILAIPLIGSIQVFSSRFNHFAYMIDVRHPHATHLSTPYLKKEMKRNFMLTYVLYLGRELLISAIICVFYSPFIFLENSSYLTWVHQTNFSTNGLLNYVVFITLLPLGYAVFSTFIFIVCLYMKKYVFALTSGLVLGLICTILPPVLLLPTGYELLMYTLFLPSITEPGITLLGSRVPSYSTSVLFVASLVFYSVLSAVLYVVRMRIERKEGY